MKITITPDHALHSYRLCWKLRDGFSWGNHIHRINRKRHTMALQSIADKLIAHTPPGQFRAFALTMLRRMAEIDPHEDAPDGDNYNELWDAIIDELLAAMEPRL